MEMEKELKEWLELHKFYMYNTYLTKDLAQYLKVSPRTIQRWLKGKISPSKDQLTKIQTYLNNKKINQE